MPISGSLNLHPLVQAGETYLSNGWSVIPIQGDNQPDHPKAPLTAWKAYQRRLPTFDELNAWFNGEQAGGIAIVTGMISKLVVLDFDSPYAFIDFKDRYPGLAHTLTIRTPHGLHLYWRAGFTVKSQRVQGGDLKGEGGYVIAPPTHIGEHDYHPLNALPLLEITPNALRAVLNDLKLTTQLPTPNSQLTHKSGVPNTEPTLTHQYQSTAPLTGRNNALYQIARRAFQHGWSLDNVLEQLTQLHIHELPHHPHIHETPAQRYQEARATIHSAYKAAAPITPQTPTDTPTGLPNSVREKLLETQIAQTQHSCAASRVLDALLLSGWQAGKIFSQAQATQACKRFNIGRRSALAALCTKTPTGRLFPKHTSPPVGGGAARDSNRRGRSTDWYIMPAIDDLCRALGVENSPSDPIPAAALADPKTYRQAVHRALLERREGQYPREWLAQRLGVSRWTIARYNRELAVQVTPVYGYLPLTWDNIDDYVPKEKPQQRRDLWLEDDDGTRFPAVRGLGCKLLKQKKSIALVRQQPNYYQIGGETVSVLWRCWLCDAYTRGERPRACVACQTAPPSPARHDPPLLGNALPGQSPPTPLTGRPGKESTPHVITLHRHTGKVTHSPLPADSPRLKRARLVLTFQNVETTVPPDEFFEPGDGWWKTDYLWVPEINKKYPPLRGLAYRLLKEYGVGQVFRMLYYEADE